MIGIYKILVSINEVYIGATNNLRRRRNEHNSRKHGHKGQFSTVCELPKDVSQEVLDNYEIFTHDQFKEAGYKMLNLKTPGKEGKHCSITKNKMRKLKLGISQTKEHIENRVSQFKTPINMFDMKGNFLKEFPGIADGGRFLNINPASISQCLKGVRKSINGFTFNYKTKECTYSRL